MTRLLIHVEGQTEEMFVNQVLAPHLYTRGYTKVFARLVGNARQRGGIQAWPAVRKDILEHLREDRGRLATMLVNYYGLPKTGQRAWPGRSEAGELPFDRKAVTVESAISRDITTELGDHFDPRRFVPFVLMHEFEGLLFSDCERFASAIGRADLAPAFQAIRDGFATPEEINDSPITAPSKRVENLVPGYRKPNMGVLAMQAIGLEAICRECPHFASWLVRLQEAASGK